MSVVKNMFSTKKKNDRLLIFTDRPNANGRFVDCKPICVFNKACVCSGGKCECIRCGRLLLPNESVCKKVCSECLHSLKRSFLILYGRYRKCEHCPFKLHNMCDRCEIAVIQKMTNLLIDEKNLEFSFMDE